MPLSYGAWPTAAKPPAVSKRPTPRDDLTQASEESALVPERTNSQDHEDLARGYEDAGVRTLEARLQACAVRLTRGRIGGFAYAKRTWSAHEPYQRATSTCDVSCGCSFACALQVRQGACKTAAAPCRTRRRTRRRFRAVRHRRPCGCCSKPFRALRSCRTTSARHRSGCCPQRRASRCAA
jgi:hypothetical protein